MLANYVPSRKTPLTFDQAASSMALAIASVLGETPPMPVLALALGKTALETGRWSAIWNSNWGNIKASAKFTGTYTCIVLNEVLGGKVVWFAPDGELTANPAKGGRLVGAPVPVPEGHPQTRMRAFPTTGEGALDYVRFVAGGRYATAWHRLLAGDGSGYVHELKRAGYFTADEETYRRTTVSLQQEFVRKLQGLQVTPVHVPAPEVVREWLAPQDIDLLEAAFVDRGRDILDENRRAALREMSGGEFDPAAESEPPPKSVA
jgi:hypothetical protein